MVFNEILSSLFLDTAYTERYMGLATEDDNSAGYDVSPFPLTRICRSLNQLIHLPEVKRSVDAGEYNGSRLQRIRLQRIRLQRVNSFASKSLTIVLKSSVTRTQA